MPHPPTNPSRSIGRRGGGGGLVRPFGGVVVRTHLRGVGNGNGRSYYYAVEVERRRTHRHPQPDGHLGAAHLPVGLHAAIRPLSLERALEKSENFDLSKVSNVTRLTGCEAAVLPLENSSLPRIVRGRLYDTDVEPLLSRPTTYHWRIRLSPKNGFFATAGKQAS
eukprot:102631-Prorocentrum_minimum.AAC.1